MPTKRAISSEAGARKTWAVSSSWTRRPAIITPTRSPSVIASARSWVTSTVLTRSSRRMRARSPMSSSRVGWSSAENGSSSSRSSGSSTRARARATRCASPPDSVRAGRAGEAGDGEAGEPARALPLDALARHAAEAQAHGDVRRDRRVGEERLLEHAGHAAPDAQALRGASRARPGSARVPAVGSLEQAHHAQEGGLARAVGPDQGQDLAGSHRRCAARRGPRARAWATRMPASSATGVIGAHRRSSRKRAGPGWRRDACESCQCRSRPISSIS